MKQKINLFARFENSKQPANRDTTLTKSSKTSDNCITKNASENPENPLSCNVEAEF
jgi:hypothetical protein